MSREEVYVDDVHVGINRWPDMNKEYDVHWEAKDGFDYFDFEELVYNITPFDGVDLRPGEIPVQYRRAEPAGQEGSVTWELGKPYEADRDTMQISGSFEEILSRIHSVDGSPHPNNIVAAELDYDAADFSLEWQGDHGLNYFHFQGKEELSGHDDSFRRVLDHTRSDIDYGTASEITERVLEATSSE